jgi:hypothetical protein
MANVSENRDRNSISSTLASLFSDFVPQGTEVVPESRKGMLNVEFGNGWQNV